jgi:hypothetical protein
MGFTDQFKTLAGIGLPGGSGGGPVAIGDITDWPAGVSATEVGHLDGVTSNLQDQLDGKAASVQTIDEKTSAYTVVAGDASKILNINSSSNLDVTVNGSTDVPVGRRVDILRYGTGEVTIVASGATVNSASGLRLRARYSMASLLCVAADTYVLVGDLKV